MVDEIVLTVRGVDLPGRAFERWHDLEVGLQKRREVVDSFAADQSEVNWTVPITVKSVQTATSATETSTTEEAEFDVGGPYVHGRRGDRFLYIVWHSPSNPGDSIRRAKLKLNALTSAQISAGESAVDVRLRLDDGTPIAATIKPDFLTWHG